MEKRTHACDKNSIVEKLSLCARKNKPKRPNPNQLKKGGGGEKILKNEREGRKRILDQNR